MKIEVIPIDALKPYENNAKIHTPVQVAQIATSIQELGNNDPIEVDENNMVLAGHGRLLALKSLGRTEVEVIRHKGMTEEQKRAYILVHNQLTLNSGWDYNILDAELARIEDIDMTAFDFGSIDVSVDDFGEHFQLNDSDAPLVRTISMSLTPEQNEIWVKAIGWAVEHGAVVNPSEKTNMACNAIAAIVSQFLEGVPGT
ncbi:MAG: ParB N-terminal domain-containing protein [Rikenellaceae bacterium]|nr:ParB N-terminal domain-containing protein [Rikenellaceae bacterium]